MPFVFPAILAAVSGISGFLNSRKKNQQQQQQQSTNHSVTNSSSTSNFNNTSSSMPAYDPTQLRLRDALASNFSSRMDAGNIDKILGGQLALQLGAAGQGAGALQRATQTRFANAGMAGSPALLAALAQQDQDRVSNQIGILNQFPLLKEQLIQTRLSQAADFFKGLPVGQTNTSSGTTSTSGTSTTDGTSTGTATTTGPQENPWGVGLDNLFTTLAGLYGSGAFAQQAKPAAGGSVVRTTPPRINLVPPIVAR